MAKFGRNGGSTLALAIVMATTWAVPAMSQDVVMRRPLGNGAAAQSCDPSDPSCTTTPTPTPTPPPPPSGPKFYYWNDGAWSGSATCGQTSTLTRTVDCHVFDISTFSDSTTADSDCVANGQGAKPITSYTGTEPGCVYNLVSTPGGPWSSLCSYSATRPITNECQDASGHDVDMKFCQLNLQPDQYDNYISDVETSSQTSGCTASWVGDTGATVCDGSQLRAATVYECMQQQPGGSPYQVDDSVCTDPKPTGSTGSVVGACMEYFDRDGGGYCTGSVIAKQTLPSYRDTFYQGHGADTNAFCVQSGATCCEEWQGYDANDTWYAVAMTGTASGGSRDHSVKEDNSRWNPGDPLPRYDVYNARDHIVWVPAQ